MDGFISEVVHLFSTLPAHCNHLEELLKFSICWGYIPEHLNQTLAVGCKHQCFQHAAQVEEHRLSSFLTQGNHLWASHQDCWFQRSLHLQRAGSLARVIVGKFGWYIADIRSMQGIMRNELWFQTSISFPALYLLAKQAGKWTKGMSVWETKVGEHSSSLNTLSA